MRQPKLEPVFFGKPDEDAGGTTVPRNDNLFFDREAKLLGEVILHLRQSHFLRFLGLASLAPRAMPGPRLSCNREDLDLRFCNVTEPQMWPTRTRPDFRICPTQGGLLSQPD
jgi:hypothetical protein